MTTPESQRVMAAKAKRQPLAPDDPRHGTNSAYQNWKCRCPPCRAAHAREARKYRRSKLTPKDDR